MDVGWGGESDRNGWDTIKKYMMRLVFSGYWCVRFRLIVRILKFKENDEIENSLKC